MSRVPQITELILKAKKMKTNEYLIQCFTEQLTIRFMFKDNGQLINYPLYDENKFLNYIRLLSISNLNFSFNIGYDF